MSKKRKLLETLNGMGRVFSGDEHISDVRYSLQIFQEYLISQSFSGTDEIPGHKEIVGQIAVISGERNLIHRNNLTLHLEDNSKWAFFASKGDPISGNYRVVHTGGKGIVSE